MYLIDGYNVLYQTMLETREELIEKINRFCQVNSKQALIVFDGYSPEDLSSQTVEIRFVGDADQEIIEVLNDNNNPTSLTLVSSDNELAFEARKNKVQVIKSEHFVQIMDTAPVSTSEEKDEAAGLNDKEAKSQLKEFNYFQK